RRSRPRAALRVQTPPRPQGCRASSRSPQWAPHALQYQRRSHSPSPRMDGNLRAPLEPSTQSLEGTRGSQIASHFQSRKKRKGAVMTVATSVLEDLTVTVSQEIRVRASLDTTFAALLEQLGPYNEKPDGDPLPMVLEPWPGGRWYRDLGNGNGHFWATVQ